MTWKYFVLGPDKSPLANCPRCRDAGSEHDRESCACLTCHALYAATDDEKRLDEMSRRYPANPWAVRTGAASGIIVLDAEGYGDPSGVDVLDAWETWAGVTWPLPETERIALTPSGGVHRYYVYTLGVRSRNRVLPGIDIKSDGGYVVIPHANTPSRIWLKDKRAGAVNDNFRDWLIAVKGRNINGTGGVAGHAPGYDYEAFVRDGCPDGVRDEFFNELAFRLRKAGVDRGTATVRIRDQWKRAAQPPEARWYMPWKHVAYKIERIWHTVPVDEITDSQRDWIAGLLTGEPVKIGRVTLVSRDAT